jgi:hypothetical protein
MNNSKQPYVLLMHTSHAEPKAKQKPHDKDKRQRLYIRHDTATQGRGKQERATHVSETEDSHLFAETFFFHSL